MNTMHFPRLLGQLAIWLSPLLTLSAHAATFTDDFSAGISTAYWNVTQTTPGLYSVDATQRNLQLAKTTLHTPGGLQNVAFNLNLAALGGAISGDFSAQISFANAVIPGPGTDQVELHAHFQDASYFFDVFDNSFGKNVHVWNGSVHATTTVTGDSGTFRITRVGALVSGYYNNILIYSENHASPLTQLVFVLQNNLGSDDATSVTFDDFSLTAASVTLQPDVTLFIDNFATDPSPLWNNARGAWFASGGTYAAAAPLSNPATYTGLPFVLRNFSFDVDITQIADGGIWLRSDAAGTNGVLLVTGGNGWGHGVRDANAGRSLYWHVITAANYANPPKLNEVQNVFAQPGVENAHLRIEVTGDQYAVYLNGASTPTTTLIDSDNLFRTGRVGFYSFSSQTFDNVVLKIPPGFGPYLVTVTQPDATHALLAWSTNAYGWNLDTTTAPGVGPWTTITNAPTITGANFTLTVGYTNAQQIFQLRQP